MAAVTIFIGRWVQDLVEGRVEEVGGAGLGGGEPGFQHVAPAHVELLPSLLRS